MNAFETLCRLAAGERPEAGVLHTARLGAFGTEAYGEEAIVELFRRQVRPIAETMIRVEAMRHLALFAPDYVLFAG